VKPLALVAAMMALAALPSSAEEGGTSMAFSISSSAFKAGGSIPREFTADGRDVSPALSWENPPPGTQSFALICDDPDVPVGTWIHWVLWNIPASARGLPQGVPALKVSPDGSAQGKNDFGRIGYGGPSPPRGKPHRYFFRLYALGQKLSLAAGASRKQLDAAMAGKILAAAELVGTYGR
jgi:Raf kinase inhibitor-like YbhB/YbcL family protein